ncbi:hypothetical protein MT325_m549L [Paramecium bursaria chlorella virus MT325]|uniref:Uncharacterized protein m549L n=2 Tax=Paramecium bursaria Chlorella virus A1 TaxID=381899 RepID=A7IUS9_PBCVM|nr:hypothetical protein FR483_n555L [Paramecium bursaria Chlorella virus FR483]ABT14103.1 hypothetical protein MT325_m549L [Paramecium bursaria chlorella virus MT325]ABT15840.1 hypothetical protein FR483_n555L [Paramecium bursaria Chlorella virus FR483]
MSSLSMKSGTGMLVFDWSNWFPGWKSSSQVLRSSGRDLLKDRSMSSPESSVHPKIFTSDLRFLKYFLASSDVLVPRPLKYLIDHLAQSAVFCFQLS